MPGRQPHGVEGDGVAALARRPVVVSEELGAAEPPAKSRPIPDAAKPPTHGVASLPRTSAYADVAADLAGARPPPRALQ